MLANPKDTVLLGVLPLGSAVFLVWIVVKSLIQAPASQRWSMLGIVLAGVVLMFGYQGFLGKARRAFAAGTNTRSEKFWRMTNEIPFVLAIAMVLAVTTKFGGG